MKAALSELDGLAGYQSPRYAPGLRTTHAMLEAGRRLLRQMSLEQLTINDLCARAEVTTGAFYTRFESKEVFFNALQVLVQAELRDTTALRMGQFDARQWGLREMIEQIARHLRLWAYRHEGVLRASIIQRAREGDDPVKRLNMAYVEQAVPRLARIHPAGPSPLVEQRILYAFQMMLGTLVYALVNQGGTLALTDRRTEREMARAFYLYVTQELT
ncbi:TetR/AcrR family transcriptional regulator [Pseudomonas nitroreducens]|uniref:TetR/AcrR family transcriptional regulator n=1 Tax=Pseudomonas nitroreducens TaxID=46680 RepID=A0A5R8ZSV1_PSENT|nr:TetR/AcrR family transcriptional regulator [Pseudomonas nitroreducens]TLP68667.1 TetR/AcrR family transcriptional regulator [Pseudomonas nitroreducens]